mgnify:CR=1 FL=1
MKIGLTIIKRAVPLACSALLVSGGAQAALQDRDLDGDTVVDAFYDTDRDITWLRNADVNGPMDWNSAVAWANGLIFAGFSDWRLPTLGPTDNCVGVSCAGGEMGHLWYVELGNSPGAMTNTGDFQNLLPSIYWYAGGVWNPGSAWAFNMSFGNQGTAPATDAWYAMAVRDGDVPSIPEPETHALMLAGLGLLALARRLQRR